MTGCARLLACRRRRRHRPSSPGPAVEQPRDAASPPAETVDPTSSRGLSSLMRVPRTPAPERRADAAPRALAPHGHANGPMAGPDRVAAGRRVGIGRTDDASTRSNVALSTPLSRTATNTATDVVGALPLIRHEHVCGDERDVFPLAPHTGPEHCRDGLPIPLHQPIEARGEPCVHFDRDSTTGASRQCDWSRGSDRASTSRVPGAADAAVRLCARDVRGVGSPQYSTRP
jgi:hypothetical protein